MKASDKEKARFEVTDKFKKRALQLLDESQGAQFAEGMRLNNAAAMVFGREAKRLEQKYGKDDPRTQEMSARLEASALAKVDLFGRYKDAITPQTQANEGWTVDGFVRAPDGRGLEGITVAAHDRQGNRLKDLGQSTTNDQGHFLITVDKLPKKPPGEVFMRASKGRTVLPSNEVILAPRAGASERVEIIITRGKPTDPTQGVRPVDNPPEPGVKPNDRPTDKPTDKPTDAAVEPRPSQRTDTGATIARTTIGRPPTGTAPAVASKRGKSGPSQNVKGKAKSTAKKPSGARPKKRKK